MSRNVTCDARISIVAPGATNLTGALEYPKCMLLAPLQLDAHPNTSESSTNNGNIGM
jgi:hypothetical protein